MRAAFATLLALFTLFTCTAAQSPIITTSTSNTLSDDFQDDDLSDISVPENDDLNPALDDSSQVSVGAETSSSGVQSSTSLSVDDFASQVSPTPSGVSSTSEAAAPTTQESENPAPTSSPLPSPTTPPAASPTPAPLAPGRTSSPEAPTTPSPSEPAVVEEDATEAGVSPTEAAVADPTTTMDDSSATPSPSPASSTESPGAEATTSANGATGLWVGSWVTVSTAAVGALGVIALRFGVFAREL